jgi:hypothetical protein
MADETDAYSDAKESGDPEEILEQARKDFTRCEEWHSENYQAAIDDIRFARLTDQWPEEIKKDRERERRPCLTINKLPAFIRQVVNDARQNKPTIKVRPVDSGSDPETAEIFNGIIRNIEQSSNADVAYDTAADFAVCGGIGYIRVAVEFAHDDTFEKELRIERVSNPFAVFGDPDSQAADSSDWNVAFLVDMMPKKAFEAKYKEAEKVDWDAEGYAGLGEPWLTEESVMIAEYWTRREVDRPIVLLSNGMTVDREAFDEAADLLEAEGVTIVEERTTKSYRVKQCILTGAEVLEENEWAGKYIPIIPVYGDEVNLEGKRHFRSLIRDAKDAQRMFNYWRTAATELVALAPKAPWIGPEGAFDSMPERWDTANTESHNYLEYSGSVAPQRVPFTGVPAGHLQEALNASDDMKAIMGVYDASLGARSNETSGRAIMARQREGDVSTFHFLDNLSRAIRHTGRVLIDLIPMVYTGERIVRVLGEDGSVDRVPLNQPAPVKGPEGEPQVDPQTQQPMTRIYDLAAGKYDLTVSTGPSYTTQRQETAEQMMQLLQAFPQAAPVIGDLLVKNLDWQGADEISDRLKAMLPPQVQGPNPEVQAMTEQMQKLGEAMQKLTAENEQLKLQAAGMKADNQADMMGVEIDRFEAETGRMKVVNEILRPPPQPATSGRPPARS